MPNSADTALAASNSCMSVKVSMTNSALYRTVILGLTDTGKSHNLDVATPEFEKQRSQRAQPPCL